MRADLVYEPRYAGKTTFGNLNVGDTFRHRFPKDSERPAIYMKVYIPVEDRPMAISLGSGGSSHFGASDIVIPVRATISFKDEEQT